jgi:hypothetical protein
VIKIEFPICKNIELEDLSIDKRFNIITLSTAFEHCGFQYDADFRYNQISKEWYLSDIYHTNMMACSLCIENSPQILDEYYCRYLLEFRCEIRQEIMADAVIKEKIKNFRLEAITAGFDY